MMLASDETVDDDAYYILRWIKRHARQEFTKSEAQHHGKRRFPKADDIDLPLEELARRGFIRPKPTESSGPGRPPSPVYEVNPAVYADVEPEKRSQNSRNSLAEPDCGASPAIPTDSEPEKRSYNSRNSAAEPESGNFRNIGSAFEQPEKSVGSEVSSAASDDAQEDVVTSGRIDWLEENEALALLRPMPEAEAEPELAADGPLQNSENPPLVCRCGSTAWRDVVLEHEPHNGNSIRRECARCGWLLDFPLWYGKPNSLHGSTV
jgi:hypothetical protein